ncbi:GntR family transcriptional regulator [Pelagibius sp. Alg239-R121]|uniref:GntR family transcriptional regulator n=1 Tax=Pelagibius sp. Alg239-R121 TaxID=2993448 RepID=UPI0024A6BD90|nr:GntR family transcriptional regulator [Pelagibius sp. Alg239-R121]
MSKPSRGEIPGLAAVPLYEQVKRHISELILLGEWLPGTVLPSETELARRFGVAVGTARRALADLTAEGLLMRRRKTGTVVTGRSPHHSLRFFFQYFRLHGLDGSLMNSSVEIKKAERRLADASEAERLALNPQDPIIRVERVRTVGGRAVMHDVMVLPAEQVPDLKIDDIPDRLYLYLLEEYGIRVSAVRESLGAELATVEDCRLIDVAMPGAILVIDEVAFEQTGAPVIWAIHRAVTDKYRYLNEVS